MAKKKRRRHSTLKDSWPPLVEGMVSPEFRAFAEASGSNAPDAVYSNGLYQVSEYIGDGLTHLSIKRQDREVVRDWRHLQAIKNEVCGPERTAIEIFPPESQLVDSANEYHLWVLPADAPLPFGFKEKLVSSDYQVEDFNAGRERGEHKGRQRPFQPGLSMAEDRNEQPDADRSMMEKATEPMKGAL